MLQVALICLIAPEAALSFPAASDISFAPVEGMQLSKHFTGELDWEGGDLEVVMGGQPVPSEYLPDLRLTSHREEELHFIDRYRKVEGGRVLELERSFEDLSLERRVLYELEGADMNDSGDDSTAPESELEGERVLFALDRQSGDYKASFLGEGPHPRGELLTGLVEGTDLVGFLPGEPVEPGASWTVPAEAFGELFAPGGDLAFEVEEGEPLELVGYEGKLDARYRGGESLKHIELEGEVTVILSRPTDLERVPVVDGQATETWELVCELGGELRWDSAAGHARSLELAGSLLGTIRTERDPSEPGPTYESTIHLDGEISTTAEFEER